MKENAASQGRVIHTYNASIPRMVKFETILVYTVRSSQGYTVPLSQNKNHKVGNANSMPLVVVSLICPKCRVTFT